jgi:hypothetical protein
VAVNYAPLITEWTTLTGAATVTTLAGAEAVPANLATLAALTVTGSVPPSTTITGTQFCNCLNWTEVKAQNAVTQGWLQVLCQMAQVPGGTTANFVSEIFADVGASMPISGTNLQNAVVATVTPWWQYNSYPQPISLNDLLAAGIITASLAHQAGLD